MRHAFKSLNYSVSLALVAMVALSSCGKKAEAPPPAPPPAAAPATTPAPAATGAAQTAPGSTTATKPALTEAAQKLGVKPKDANTCPDNAPVKGNVTKKRGELYFTSTFADYKLVKPEICFKDTATAEKAGFRAPKAQ